MSKNEVGLQCDEFFGELLDQLLVQRRPAIVDPNVATLRPSKLLESLPVNPISTPIRRIRLDCCARAASGHATAAPTSVRNLRRLTLVPQS